MNFFDGTIRLENGQLVFVEGKFLKGSLSSERGFGAASEPSHGQAPFTPGELTFPPDGFTLWLDYLPPAVKDRLSSRVGRHVVLGVRPEHLHLNPVVGQNAARESFAAINVRLNVIEPLGSNMDVYMNTALHDQVVGRLEAQGGLQSGAQTSIYIDLRRVHFFEPGVTGMNLSLETLSPTSELYHALA
ncbi:MAG: TOBE domain-containing protein [Planctomycetota bacterium]|nr:TOBE domain-containing protein [Planctomycetota bacterium]